MQYKTEVEKLQDFINKGNVEQLEKAIAELKLLRAKLKRMQNMFVEFESIKEMLSASGDLPEDYEDQTHEGNLNNA